MSSIKQLMQTYNQYIVGSRQVLQIKKKVHRTCSRKW